MIQAPVVTGHYSPSFGMFERQALEDDLEQRAISLGKGVVLPFTRDLRIKGTKPFACMSAAELGFSEGASTEIIFATIAKRGGVLLERDDAFIFVSGAYRHHFSGCCVLYTEPFDHQGLLVLPAFHCGQRILIEPISASKEPLFNPNTRFVFGL
jgi:hypothetical protein